MVLLDVVYNHFGPDGNYLHAYARAVLPRRIQTPWGAAIEFRGRPVRDFFIHNALYWLKEYRFDGLRFDAVHAISRAGLPRRDGAHDPPRRWNRGRHVHLILENEGNKARHLAAGVRRAVERRLAPLPARRC